MDYRKASASLPMDHERLRAIRCCSVALLLGTFVLAPRAASAQWVNPYTGNHFSNPVSSFMDTIILHQVQRQLLEQSLRARAARGGPAEAPPTHKRLSASDFKPPQEGHPTVAAFLASVDATGEKRKEWAAVIDAAFAGVSKLRKNNLASAVATVIGMSRMIVGEKEIPDEELLDLRFTINDALASSPAIAKMKAKDKQVLYEALIIDTALLALYMEAGKTDANLKAAGTAAAQELLQKLAGSPGAN